MSASVAVIVACTLAGGVKVRNGTRAPPETCRVGSQILDCSPLDRETDPAHIIILWCLTLGGLVLLGLPTVLARSPQKRQGMQHLASLLLQTLCVMTGCVLSDHPSINYALSAHASVLTLTRMHVGPPLWGGASWWGMRYGLVGALLMYMVMEGPAVSLVHWPASAETRTCAFIAHLAGSTAPCLIIDALQGALVLARALSLRDP